MYLREKEIALIANPKSYRNVSNIHNNLNKMTQSSIVKYTPGQCEHSARWIDWMAVPALSVQRWRITWTPFSATFFNTRFLKPWTTAIATSISLGHRHNSDRAFRYVPRTTIRRKLHVTLQVAQRLCPQHTPELHDKPHKLCFMSDSAFRTRLFYSFTTALLSRWIWICCWFCAEAFSLDITWVSKY